MVINPACVLMRHKLDLFLHQNSISMLTTINIKELNQILSVTPTKHNLLLVGKHGIGKSEILSNYFTSQGKTVISFFLGQMSDPGDLIGLPYKNEKTKKTEFMPPYWFPTEGNPIVLFLDELNRARPEILQCIMELTLNRTLAGHSLPVGSQIIAAVNDGEEYQLTDLDPALISRFNVYRFQPSVAEWLLWATNAGIDERIIDFISKEPRYLDNDDKEEGNIDKHPDRRSWQRVSELIKGKNIEDNIIKKLIAGVIGMKTTGMFLQFIMSRYTISGKDILLHWKQHEKRISKMPLHELSILNESIFRFIETENKEYHCNTICNSLEAYLSTLLKNGKSEAYAHWISLYESNNYPQSVIFILNKLPKLYKQITNFILEL